MGRAVQIPQAAGRCVSKVRASQIMLRVAVKGPGFIQRVATVTWLMRSKRRSGRCYAGWQLRSQPEISTLNAEPALQTAGRSIRHGWDGSRCYRVNSGEDRIQPACDGDPSISLFNLSDDRNVMHCVVQVSQAAGRWMHNTQVKQQHFEELG